jgi:hypothetical protein
VQKLIKNRTPYHRTRLGRHRIPPQMFDAILERVKLKARKLKLLASLARFGTIYGDKR